MRFSLTTVVALFVLVFSLPGFVESVQSQDQQPAEAPSASSLSSRLIQTDSQKAKSIASVRKIDEHPLYVMTYYGDYDSARPVSAQLDRNSNRDIGATGWACSLFVTFGNGDQPLYGRNFDWQNNPALLLFTDPSDGYASISMVDISYLGYSRKDKKFSSAEGRENLLMAPMIPFDGMNEHGLAVGMAAVPDSKQPLDENKVTVGGLQIIRLILDKAKNVEEALTLFKQHNVKFSGGPNIHYMVADTAGNSAVIEMKDAKLEIIQGENNWNSATNFHLTGSDGKGSSKCRRYAQIDREMKNKRGALDVKEAFKLLKNVSQNSTRWSVVYDMKNQKAHVVMSNNFSSPKEFEIKDLD